MVLHSQEAFVSYTIALVVAAIVALPAINKKIGYSAACISAFALSFILIVCRIPYPLWFSSAICLIAYMRWPKAERQQDEEKHTQTYR